MRESPSTLYAWLAKKVGVESTSYFNIKMKTVIHANDVPKRLRA